MPQATRSTVPNRLVSTGMVKPLDVLEQHRRPLLGQEPGVDLGDLEHGRDRACTRTRRPRGSRWAMNSRSESKLGISTA